MEAPCKTEAYDQFNKNVYILVSTSSQLNDKLHNLFAVSTKTETQWKWAIYGISSGSTLSQRAKERVL